MSSTTSSESNNGEEPNGTGANAPGGSKDGEANSAADEKDFNAMFLQIENKEKEKYRLQKAKVERNDMLEAWQKIREKKEE
jgi:hypothetical protein